MKEIQYHIPKSKLKAIYEKLDDIDTFMEMKFSENSMTMADFFAVAKVNYEVLTIVHEVILANESGEVPTA